jgi:hypothetical protein
MALGGEEIVGYIETGLDLYNKNNELVQQSGQRFFDKGPAGSTDYTVTNAPEGNTIYTYTVPGNVPGSKAVYIKIIDRSGQTTAVKKITYDPSGEIVHIKDKY